MLDLRSRSLGYPTFSLSPVNRGGKSDRKISIHLFQVYTIDLYVSGSGRWKDPNKGRSGKPGGNLHGRRGLTIYQDYQVSRKCT